MAGLPLPRGAGPPPSSSSSSSSSSRTLPASSPAVVWCPPRSLVSLPPPSRRAAGVLVPPVRAARRGCHLTFEVACCRRCPSAVVVSPSLVIRTLIIDGVFGTTARPRVPVPVAPRPPPPSCFLAPGVVLLVGSVGRLRIPVISVASLVLLLFLGYLARREFLSVRVEQGMLASLPSPPRPRLDPPPPLDLTSSLALVPLLLFLLLRIGG